MRDRGILTERDRELLRGQPSTDRYSEFKSRTRYRVENLVTDFELLAEHDPDLLEEIEDMLQSTQVTEQELSEKVELIAEELQNHRQETEHTDLQDDVEELKQNTVATQKPLRDWVLSAYRVLDEDFENTEPSWELIADALQGRVSAEYVRDTVQTLDETELANLDEEELNRTELRYRLMRAGAESTPEIFQDAAAELSNDRIKQIDSHVGSA